MQLSTVLSYASLSGLDKSKLDLNDSERMLDFGLDLGFQGFGLIGNSVFGRVGQNTSFTRSHGNVPGGLALGAPLGPAVTSISKDGALVFGEKFFDRGEVMHVGTRRCRAVHKPRLCIDPNMRLNSKVSVIAFLV